jgi:hypothetical protein
MTDQQAKRLMAEGEISNYVMVDGNAEIKAPIGGKIPPSWPATNKRSE